MACPFFEWFRPSHSRLCLSRRVFQPFRIRTDDPQHLQVVAMAPMARFRADTQSVRVALSPEYHKRRTSAPGKLAITESMTIAQRAGGFVRNSETSVCGATSKSRAQVGRRSHLWADCRCGAQKLVVRLSPAHRSDER